jgi:hypothetical protein
MTKRRARKPAALGTLPKRVEKMGTSARKAITKAWKDALAMLPARPRKTVEQAAARVEKAATRLETRGQKALKVAEKRRKEMVGRVEKAATTLEKRGQRALRAVEKQRKELVGRVEKGAVEAMKPLVHRLDVASKHDVDRLSRRIAQLERRLARAPKRAVAA